MHCSSCFFSWLRLTCSIHPSATRCLWIPSAVRFVTYILHQDLEKKKKKSRIAGFLGFGTYYYFLLFIIACRLTLPLSYSLTLSHKLALTLTFTTLILSPHTICHSPILTFSDILRHSHTLTVALSRSRILSHILFHCPLLLLLSRSPTLTLAVFSGFGQLILVALRGSSIYLCTVRNVC